MFKIKLQSEYNDLDKYNDNGDIVYCKKDTSMYHNPYGPAIICKDGHKEYWIENKYDRLEAPTEKILEVKLESEYDDLDKFIYNNKNTVYYKKDTKLFHNPYGPAYIKADGSKVYYINNKIHRTDGPAIMFSNGVNGYFINDEEVSEKDFYTNKQVLESIGK